MNFGFVYSSVHIYRMVMRSLYGGDYYRKYRAVADLIPAEASVCDLCAGDCMLAGLLPHSASRYLGLELNPRFVAWARRSGINARLFDARTEEIPAADVVCIQSSLYQFIPEDDVMVARMVASARKMVIVSEPIVNVASGRNSVLSHLASRGTAVDGKQFSRRHTLETLTQTLKRVAPHTELVELQKREALFVIRKQK